MKMNEMSRNLSNVDLERGYGDNIEADKRALIPLQNMISFFQKLWPKIRITTCILILHIIAYECYVSFMKANLPRF